jgi:glycine/serine hydroxymethyltransferase
MAEAFVKRYDIISGGTDNHMMFKKQGISGRS